MTLLHRDNDDCLGNDTEFPLASAFFMSQRNGQAIFATSLHGIVLLLAYTCIHFNGRAHEIMGL